MSPSIQAVALGARITLAVDGGDELAAELSALPKRVQRGIAIRALQAGAEPMLAAVKAGIHSRTGLLAAKTRARPGKGDRPGRFSVLISSVATAGAFAKARLKSGRAAEAAAVLSRHAKSDKYRVFYGYFVEGGHGGPRPAPPHPFAGPGFDATVEVSADIAEKALVAGIEAAN